MICKSCQHEISGKSVVCETCKSTLHDDCAFRCVQCGAHLCDECALKQKFKCSECYNVQQFDMEFISSTMFESYLKCPNAFKHEFVLKTIPEEMRANKYSATGSLLHDLFEKYSLIRPLTDEVHTAIHKEAEEKYKELDMALFDSQDDWLVFFLQGRKTIDNWFFHEIEEPVPLYTEKQEFVVLSDKLPKIRVTFDRINGAADKPDEWEVLDYKTGKVYSSTMLDANMQLPIYAMAIKKMYGEYPKRMRLVFPQHTYKDGSVKERVFERITDDVYVCSVSRGGTYSISLTQRMEQMIEIYEKIKRGEFDYNTKNTHFCENFCPLGMNGACEGLTSRWSAALKRGY